MISSHDWHGASQTKRSLKGGSNGKADSLDVSPSATPEAN